ncbi:TPA: hypothetical protein N0F65_002856 [Lagenidium giganteum]|uniref:Dihydroxyacetone kinase n=1 Tax=Lagenidium giganteum TaxID=4803 RepID=A0AAV2Z7P8_9STRA|nr:TPA: hypothetical protein N0F65_002856 [Lagenidium giganteum]
MKTKQLVHDAAIIVDDMVEGLVLASPHLVLLKDERVVLHKDFKHIRERQVTLLSGGGSGHEPAHAGYIGEGMLTGAICGGVFASPSTQQVLSAIRLAAGPKGCLVIVKNYTGDRINFGLAVEQAKAEGLKVDLVIVGEDVAVVNANAGRRGLSGTVFIHKLAGAAAAQGQDLEAIVQLVNGITQSNSVGTMGVAIKACTLPGQEEQSRELGDDEMELGLGIHGEPGVQKCELQGVPALTKLLVDQIASVDTPVGLALGNGSKAVLMVNNLGSTTNMELYVVAKYAIKALEAKGIEVERTVVGSFMTALDMAGFSLSLWKSNGDAALLKLFDAPTSAPAWSYQATTPAATKFIDAAPAPATGKAFVRPSTLTPQAAQLEKCIQAACRALIESEPELTHWDSKVGDGDCGTTFKSASEAILADMAAHYPLDQPAETLRAIAASIRHSAGGTSGVLYDIFFTAGALKLEQLGQADASAWAKSFRAGIAAVQKYGGAKEGSRTMMDALLPAQRAVDDLRATSPNDGLALLVAAATAADAGADKTRTISTKQAFGRSGYVGESFAHNIPDPGAKAAAFWLKALQGQVQTL